MSRNNPAGAPVGTPDRLVTLDFIRGVAVLGILFANIVAFAHPHIAYSWPGGLPEPMSKADTGVWLAQYLVIDGKMRGLFTLLFGVGMAVFMDRAWERGQTRWLQIRRLLWLGAFGLAHFFFLFWGDILFLYAIAGLAVLPMLRWRPEGLLCGGLVWYAAGALYTTGAFASTVMLEQSPQAQQAARADYKAIEARIDTRLEEAAAERAAYTEGSYATEIRYVAERQSGQLWQDPLFAIIETIPLMMIGIALYRFGLFGGFPGVGIDVGTLRRWAWAGIVVGGGASLALALWAMGRGFPPYLSQFVASDAAQLPRLAMILGYAVLLAQWAPRAAAGWVGSRLVAAGRMAFSNYIGTSVAMMLVFRHWAGGQFGELGRVEMLAPVLLGWVLMLAWSKPWLAHFRYGPLEWLWRCLTYWKVFPFRR